VRWTNNLAAFPGTDALAEFADGDEIAAVAIRCDRAPGSAGALERLEAQLEASVLRAIWLLVNTWAIDAQPAGIRTLAVETLVARPVGSPERPPLAPSESWFIRR
jgi:hypothetical protein